MKLYDVEIKITDQKTEKVNCTIMSSVTLEQVKAIVNEINEESL